MTIAGWTPVSQPPTPRKGQVPNYLVAVYHPLLKRHYVNEAHYYDKKWWWPTVDEEANEGFTEILNEVSAWAEMPAYP